MKNVSMGYLTLKLPWRTSHLDNILKASPIRFNLRLKVWYESNSGNQEERFSDAKPCISLIWKYF
jgi:hypothetical protein